MANVSISNVGILTTGGSGDFDEYTINGVYNATIFDILGAGGGGGGGAGWGNAGGGGGGGGVFYLTDVTIAVACSIPIVVGTAGAGGVSTSSSTYTQGGDGSNTTVTIGATTYTAIGGGGGGINRLSSAVGRSGGSGGGNGDNATGAPSNDQQASSATGGYGNRGGAGNGSRGGGGGGAGAVGTLNGGAGIPLTITGATVYYGAGGGGGNYTTSTVGTGGTGGGGNGATKINNTAGTAGTGIGSGGGGGAGTGSPDGPGQAGSNGAVIITYKAFGPAATGGTITSFSNSSGTYQVHTFTSNGTFVTNSYTPIQRIYSNNSVQVVKGFDEVSMSSGSLFFNGTSQYLTVANNAAFYPGTGDYTIEAWVNLSTIDSTDRKFFNIQAPGVSTVLSGYISTTNKFATGIRSSNGTGTNDILGTTTAVANKWYHIAITRASGTIRLFVDGVLEANATSQTQSISTAGIGIGAYYNPGGAGSPGYYWNGYISNLRYINGTALYTASFTPPKSSILEVVPNTTLLLQVANSSAYITDSSPNGYTITNNGSVIYDANTIFNYSPVGTIAAQKIYSDGTFAVSGYFDETQ